MIIGASVFPHTPPNVISVPTMMRLPTAETLESPWIDPVIQRFADALDWPINWIGRAGEESELDYASWRVEISDGIHTAGWLEVSAPSTSEDPAKFQSTCEATKVFAEVLSRLVTAVRKLEAYSQDVTTLVEMGISVPQCTDLPNALSKLLQAATQIAGLYSAAFFLIDPRTSQLRLRATHQLPAKLVPHPQRPLDMKTPDVRAWQLGHVLLDRQVAADCEWLPHGITVGLGVPIMAESGFLGMLWGFDRRKKELGNWEIQVLQSVAVQIATVLERTMLLQESEQQQQLRSDLRVASTKLPVGLMELPPQDWGLDLALRAATVTGVGGDLCDVIPLGNHRTLIAIGDAVGHSIPAAMLVSVARGALRALISQAALDEVTPSSLMVGVNRALSGVTREEQFVTLLLGIIDSRNGTLSYANAGHPPPLLLRNGEWSSLTSHGLFLGVVRDAIYHTTIWKLSPNDVLVLFTDGVTEALSPSRAIFRKQGIKAAISNIGPGDANTIAAKIWRGLEQHDSGQALRDDRTLLVIRYLGEGRHVG